MLYNIVRSGVKPAREITTRYVGPRILIPFQYCDDRRQPGERRLVSCHRAGRHGGRAIPPPDGAADCAGIWPLCGFRDSPRDGGCQAGGASARGKGGGAGRQACCACYRFTGVTRSIVTLISFTGVTGFSSLTRTLAILS